MSEWQPIATVPKDGTRVLLAWKKNHSVSILWWNQQAGYSSFTTGKSDPKFGIPDQFGEDWFSHWMSLPDYPWLAPAENRTCGAEK